MIITTAINKRRIIERLARATMFCLLAFAAVLYQAREARAQWVNNDNNSINNTNSGNVGVGTTAPNLKLETKGVAGLPVSSGTAPIGIMRLSQGTGVGVIDFGFGGDAGYGWIQATSSTNLSTNFGLLLNPNGGNVGIGTSSPNQVLEIKKNQDAITGIRLTNTTPSAKAFTSYQFQTDIGIAGALFANSSGNSYYGGANSLNLVTTNGALAFGTNELIRMYVSNSGNVGIGTNSPTTRLHVEGDVKVSGNIAAKYQDVAEWVPARQLMGAGTVVVLDTEQSNQVTTSKQPYDTRVAGVVSAQPGVILGEAGENKAMIASTGRVKVKVDATRSSIKVGDLLVTSDKEGMAMKSEPLSLGGTPIHRPGTLIGKALEPLEKGTGEILVLLSLQ
ncbi:MAG TPA: hypothetical protein VF544_02190 [Pyrinomonadaceae bacterium]|jgi:hypothetical protein